MVLSTRASIADPYIVVLDVAADALRAVLFDSEARRVEGYSAQLPRRADAPEDCLDEMHRLVHAAGFRIAAVVGHADHLSWPAFENAAWFPALPEGTGIILGCGCVDRERLGLVIAGEKSMLGTVVESTPANLPAGLTCVRIDEKRWLLSGSVPEAGAAYAAFKRAIKGSMEKYLETAGAEDPHVAELDLVARRFREVYEEMSRALDSPSESRLERRLPPKLAAPQVIALVKSPAWTQRIADALGAPLTLSIEPEPAARGAALWALERIGGIEDLRALPASTGAVFTPMELSAIGVRHAQ
jgi:hypothetical protein